MKVNTKAHGPVDVLFHVTIWSKSRHKCGNFQWQVGAFSTFEKAMEAADAYIKEALFFKETKWELEIPTPFGGGWKPITSAIIDTDTGKRHKMIWELHMRYAILDSRTHHNGSRGWNWVHVNPDPEIMKLMERGMMNMEVKE